MKNSLKFNIFFSTKYLIIKYKSKNLKYKIDFIVITKFSLSSSVMYEWILFIIPVNKTKIKNKKISLSMRCILISNIFFLKKINPVIIIKKTFKFKIKFPAIKLAGIRKNKKFKKLFFDKILDKLSNIILFYKIILDFYIIYLYHY